jgi:transcription factor C subunit 6
MLDFEDENGAGPSNPVPFHDDPDSGSEFAIEDAEPETLDDLMYPEDGEEPEEFLPRSPSERPIRPIPSKAKAKQPPSDVQRTTSLQLASLPRGHTTNKMYTLPTPSVHHRHRAVPIFFRTGRVERLLSPPKLFKSPELTSTNNFTYNTLVQERLNKAWGYSISSGPLWELVEDRGWYKEAIEDGVEVEKEANRRPRVYMDVQVKKGWVTLDIQCVFFQTQFIACNVLTSNSGPPLHIFHRTQSPRTMAA